LAESTASVSIADQTESAGRNRATLARLRREVQLRYIAVVIPLILYLLFFYAYPVIAMLFRSVSEPTWSLTNYSHLVQTNVYVHVMWITVWISIVVTICTLILGYPVAYLISSVTTTKSNLLIVLVLVPFWTSILVRTYAWMVLLGRQGIINELLQSLGIIDQPLRLLNTRFAVYVSMVHILLPFMILPLYSVMRGIDRSVLRAAEGLGARPSAVFRQVMLPLSLPGVAAGCLLVFILSLGFYITPALVGGPKDLMISVLIAQQVDLFNWAFASALAAVLLVGALLIFVIFNRILGVEKIFGEVRS
jgi:ABC-type spermidine/putrescine transport system permease subunit I